MSRVYGAAVAAVVFGGMPWPPKWAGRPPDSRRGAAATFFGVVSGKIDATGSKMKLLCGLMLAGILLSASLPASAEVLKIVVNDTIHPITEEYIGRALAEAERNKDQALLIELNTPGGLLESTRNIIEKILASP